MLKARDNIVIIGGGVAGLSAALELTSLGYSPTVIEAGNYPCHKVCGEFLSPECLSFLQKWNISPVPIKKCQFHCDTKTYTFHFPTSAGSLSHWILDPLLAQRAIASGAKIFNNLHVEKIIPKNNKAERHQVILSNGETLQPDTLLIATGKLPGFTSTQKTPQYIGIKAHFKGVDLVDTLKMFSFSGAYLGICPVEEGKVNLACIASIDSFNQAPSLDEFMKRLIQKNDTLSHLLLPGEQLFDWMKASIVSIGFKQTPVWLDTYFLGDAALTIPPACGDGLSLSVLNGRLAAQYAVAGNDRGYATVYKQNSRRLLASAKVLHRLLMRPPLCKVAMRTFSMFPSLAGLLFRLTRS